MTLSLPPLSRRLVRPAFFALAGLSAAAAYAQATQLSPAPQRISDQAIQADHRAYQQLQGRLHQLNEAGVPVRNYHLSKAQCWLDVSLHEYTRNDRSAFPQEALTESEKLIVSLEQKASPLPTGTALVNGAARLRPDLWDRTAALRQHPGFQCVQQQVACAEVELVHAGNEFNQQQWRHAKPYVQIAEDLITQASQQAQACLPPAPVAMQAPAAAPVLAPAPQPVALHAQVLFDFDRFEPEHMRPASRAELDWLLARVRSEGITVQAIELVGHADRLNSTGNKDYNQQLSEKRVATVRSFLGSRGLAVSSTRVQAVGDTQQVQACEAQFKDPLALQACLLPNRRVDIRITGVRAQP